MFSSITITFAPAIVYFASSPKIPSGICSPNSAAGCVMGMCSLQCFQYASTSASFQETFRFSWAIEGKVCMNEWMGETCKLVGTKSIYLSIFYLSVINIYIYISIYLSSCLSISKSTYIFVEIYRCVLGCWWSGMQCGHGGMCKLGWNPKKSKHIYREVQVATR